MSKRADEREAELNKLARAIIGGSVFGTWSFQSDAECERMLPFVFLVLGFMDKGDALQMRREKVAHFYEYAEHAMPRQINGYPIFSTAQTITVEEFTRVLKKVQAANTAIGATTSQGDKE